MNKLEIKIESLPNRCEVCHQKDKFDPVRNICSRCLSVTSNNMNKKPLTNTEIGVAVGLVVGSVIGFGLILFDGYAMLWLGALLFGAGLWGIHGLIIGFIFRKNVNPINGILQGAITGALVISLFWLWVYPDKKDTQSWYEVIYIFKWNILRWLLASIINGSLIGFIINKRYAKDVLSSKIHLSKNPSN